MKLFLFAFVVAIALRVAVFWLRNARGRRWLARFKKYPPPHKTYLDLRHRALHAPRSAFGFLPAATPTQPWGVVMDWGLDHGIATVVAFSDGTASVYASSGGGSIGGQAHESIRHGAHVAVDVAAELLSRAHPTTYLPLPKRGKVFFYLRTDSGVFTARAKEKALRSLQHPLAPLANAMQDVITQYRLLQADPSSAAQSTSSTSPSASPASAPPTPKP